MSDPFESIDEYSSPEMGVAYLFMHKEVTARQVLARFDAAFVQEVVLKLLQEWDLSGEAAAHELLEGSVVYKKGEDGSFRPVDLLRPFDGSPITDRQYFTLEGGLVRIWPKSP